MRQPRWSEIFEHVCRCAAHLVEPLEVLVERHDGADEVRVRVLVPEGRTVTTRNADVFLAVDNAFHGLAASAQSA